MAKGGVSVAFGLKGKATFDLLLGCRKIYLMFLSNINDPVLLCSFLLQAVDFVNYAEWRAMEGCIESALRRDFFRQRRALFPHSSHLEVDSRPSK